MDHPDRGDSGEGDRQVLRGKRLVQLRRAAIPGLVEPVIDRTKIRAGEPAQEFVHRRHDVGVRVESAARDADIARAVVAETAHLFIASEYNADRTASV